MSNKTKKIFVVFNKKKRFDFDSILNFEFFLNKIQILFDLEKRIVRQNPGIDETKT